MASNFTATGTRWRVLPIDNETAMRQHVPPLPGPGLLFTSADAEMRLLSLTPDAVPTEDHLSEKSVAELAAIAKMAKPMAR